MSASIPFVFKSAPSPPTFTDTAMPCYECSMLGYSWTCQDCSRFTANTAMTPPSSPASDSVFPFDFTSPPFAAKYPVNSPGSTRLGWLSLEIAEHSAKTSRFTWSEMDYSNSESSFKNLSAKHSTSTELTHNEKSSDCHSCSMVPYGALCTNCNRIQKSKAIALATPPAAAWPITHTLGNWQGTKAPEEEILRTLDAELFEQINVPHELDEWGRRVYNDCGHRILYYQDADGNTVVGYEASFYSSSVISDYCDDEPNHHPHAGPQVRDHAADNEVAQQPVYADEDDGAVHALADSNDEKTSVISGYEAWSPSSDTSSLRTMRERDANNNFEPKRPRLAAFFAELTEKKRVASELKRRRLAAFFAELAERKRVASELKQRRLEEFFAELTERKRVASSSRREDVAAWVGSACGAEGDGGEV